MEQMIKSLVEVTLLASAMIGVILLIKALWGKRMQPMLATMLWLMVLVRLLLPIMLPSPYHLDQVQLPPITKSEARPVISDHVGETPSYQPVDTPRQSHTVALEDTPRVAKDKPAMEAKPSIDFTVVLYPMIIMLWALGAIIVLGIGGVRTWIFHRKVARCKGTMNPRLRALLHYHQARLGLRQRVKVITSSYLTSPMAFGVVKPTILIPSHYLSLEDEKLSLMMLHELTHIKRGDMLKNYLWFIARAIHWFNPMVWLAYQSYRDDVELACDRMVLKSHDGDDPTVYCQSLVDVVRYATQPIAPSVLAFCESQSNLKRRIKTMIKPNKDHKVVTMLTVMMAIIMVVSCFTTACQPTPQKAVVDDKNKSIEEVIKDNKDATTPEPEGEETPAKGFMATYETPETVTGTYTLPNINVTMDAEVIVPEMDRFASTVFTPEPMTRDLVDDFMRYFLGEGAELYKRITNQDTKSELEPRLTFWQEELFKCETDWETMKEKDYYRSDNFTKSGAIAHLKEKIKNLKKDISRAPDAVEYAPITMDDIDIYDMQPFFAKVPEGNYDGMARLIFWGQEGRGGSYHYINCVEVCDSAKTDEELQSEMKLTLDEAVSIAKKTICELGGGDVYLEHSNIRQCIKGDKYEPYYALLFTQCVSGLPVKSYYNSLAEQTGGFAPRLQSEGFTVYVDNDGVAQLVWDGMNNVVEVLDEDVHILSFDEVMQIFEEKLGLHIGAENQTNVVISKVSLDCMILPVKNDLSKGVAVPVWNFRGYHYENDKEKEKRERLNTEHWSYLTINAVDGSIISR